MTEKGERRTAQKIGILRERTLHAALKRYYEPDIARHEQPYGGYIADIVGDRGIIEIQTSHLSSMRKKLDLYLAPNDIDVTVVHPITQRKWLNWIDPENGAVVSRRRSPKVGRPGEIFSELYALAPYLSHPRFHLVVIMVDVEEYRNLDGWGRGGKRGSTRAERIPVALGEETVLNRPEDVLKLLPPLEEPFTVSMLCRAAHFSPGMGQRAVYCLRLLKLIQRVENKGRAYQYRFVKNGEDFDVPIAVV